MEGSSDGRGHEDYELKRAERISPFNGITDERTGEPITNLRSAYKPGNGHGNFTESNKVIGGEKNYTELF